MKINLCFWCGCLSALASLSAQESTTGVQGTVTLPYETLRALDREKEPPPVRAPLSTLLQSAHYVVDLATTPPSITAKMRVQHFADEWATTPILAADVSLADLQPADAVILVKDDMLQCVSLVRGKQELSFQLITTEPNSLVCLPCVSATISFVGIKQGAALECTINDVEQLLHGESKLVIPARGAHISWQEVTPMKQEALPPSEWTWRHEVAVVEEDGLVAMTCVSHAETQAGDTREAQLIFPSDLSHIEAQSDHLDQQSLQRLADGSQLLTLRWKGERLTNRTVLIHGRKRVTHLQETWQFQAPRGHAEKSDLAQFYLADQAQRKFSAAGLTGPFAPQTLSRMLQTRIQGRAYYLMESPTGVISIKQTIMPVASTADALMTKARWETRLELDGASLTTGQLDIQYRNGARLPLRLPEKAVLLSCSANDQEITPVIAAPGLWEISLPQHQQTMGSTKVILSYTERVEKFAPLEGQLSMRLPGTSYFINSLQWQLTLPAEYSAEVAGNLTRPATSTAGSHLILLEKNLCRDETPQVELFYNHSNQLNR